MSIVFSIRVNTPELQMMKQLLQRTVFKPWTLHCPVCGRDAFRFSPFGIVPRPHAQCPHCGALERHRLVKTFFEEQTELFSADEARRQAERFSAVRYERELIAYLEAVVRGASSTIVSTIAS